MSGGGSTDREWHAPISLDVLHAAGLGVLSQCGMYGLRSRLREEWFGPIGADALVRELAGAAEVHTRGLQYCQVVGDALTGDTPVHGGDGSRLSPEPLRIGLSVEEGATVRAEVANQIGEDVVRASWTVIMFHAMTQLLLHSGHVSPRERAEGEVYVNSIRACFQEGRMEDARLLLADLRNVVMDALGQTGIPGL